MNSQEMDSSQEVREHLNPWSRILDEAQERHEVQLDAFDRATKGLGALSPLGKNPFLD